MPASSMRRVVFRDDPTIWKPPAGWALVRPGVWNPPDYKPTRWELDAPPIFGLEDAKREYVKCKKSLAYFAFTYCWTLDVDDPDGIAVRKVPAYAYLREFFNAVQEPSNVHVEKSRQMLMSWAWCVVFVWDVLFHSQWTGLILSKRSTDVDDGGVNATPNSNFGKFKFVADHLPEHLWAYVVYKKFMISVPSTKSTIKGETGKGGMAARGPAYKRALMDEAAYVDRSETVFKGIRQAAKNGTCLNSTPNGKGNAFARIRFSNTTTFKKISLHWSFHPRKAVGLYCVCGWKAKRAVGLTPRDQYFQHAEVCPRIAEGKSPQMRSPWYDRETSDLTEEQAASELDIGYEKSQRGRVFSNFDQTRNVWAVLDQLGPRGVAETFEEYRWRYLLNALDPMLQTVVTWDFGVGDPTAMLLGQIVDDSGPFVRIIDEVEETDKSYDVYGTIQKTIWLPALQQIGNPYGILNYGDPAGRQRDSRLDSWVSNLGAMGIAIATKGDGSELDWLDFMNDQFLRGNLVISEWCSKTIDAVQNYHRPTDDQGNPIPGQQLPVHDEWSHISDALRYLYRIRYTARLKNRDRQGVTARRILHSGATYDRRSEGRIF